MKIFSLQSKTSLVVWSVVIGFVLNWLSYKVFVIQGKNCSDLLATVCLSPAQVGFPIRMSLIEFPLFCLNLLFWILFALIILSIIRYLRTKNIQA